MRGGRHVLVLREDPRLQVSDAFGDLCGLFCEAAIGVWDDLADTQNSGAALSEDSITDYLLLNMKRRSRQVVYYRYTRTEEHRKSGADWLWLFVSGRRGFPLLVQAKRLYSDEKYRALAHAPKKRYDQLNMLERHARQNGFFPMVCFYNQWRGRQGWAAKKFEGEHRLWGCAVAKPSQVKATLRAKPDNSLANVGPLSMPWHFLTCPGAAPVDAASVQELPDRVRDRVVRQFGAQGVPPVRERLPENIGEYLAQGLQVLDVGGDTRDVVAGVVVIGAEPNERAG